MSEPQEVTIGGRPEERLAAVNKTTNLDGRFWLIPLPEEGQPIPDVHRTAVPWAETLWACWRPLRVRDREHDQLY